MDTIKLSPDAIAALEALGQLWRQMSPTEQGYFLGEIHGMLKAKKRAGSQGAAGISGTGSSLTAYNDWR